MRIGLFGFPKVGKTTLFNTLTGSSIPTDAYATGKPETHIGIATVRDPRVDALSVMFKPKKTTYAMVEYLDIVGVEKGEGAANETFLNDLKNVDALLHVVRAFEDPALPHTQGKIDPKRDIETMETELILADLAVVSRRVEKLEENVKKGGRDEDKKELEALKKCLASLEKEIPLREVKLPDDDARRLKGYTFFSAKPLLVVLNLSESDAGKIGTAVKDFGLEAFGQRPSVSVVPVSAKIEMEITGLGAQDAASFRKDLEIEEPCLDRVIRISYALLGLISFFTVGEDECRAWTIVRESPALVAAGAIHSDIARGFIRAEVLAYDDLMTAGTWNKSKEAGKLRLKGKEYVVRDGDITHFRFNT
ncbi:MAG: redox-regulated ATPase YchF [Pseudomonadota bacterium]